MWLLHGRDGSVSPDIPLQSLDVKKHFLLFPLFLLCQLLGLPVTGFFLCMGSYQIHVAKINTISSPLRDTLITDLPATSSLACLSCTSQARACSEVSSAQAESVRAIS